MPKTEELMERAKDEVRGIGYQQTGHRLSGLPTYNQAPTS